MSSFRIRPRFKHALTGQSNDIQNRLLLEVNPERLLAVHVPGHVYLKIHPNHRQVWSPQLNLSFEQEGEQVVIRGLYGPNPTLWSIFFFGYAALGILSLFAAMWGFSQYSLGQPAWTLWVLPILGGLALMMYLAAQAGQKLGAQQMFELHHFYETVMQTRQNIQ